MFFAAAYGDHADGAKAGVGYSTILLTPFVLSIA
jgi:hypothetical protein